MANTQEYEVTVNGQTFVVQADSFVNAAEAAALEYDSQPSVNFALAENNTTVEALVKSPLVVDQFFTIKIQCTLRPYYQQA